MTANQKIGAEADLFFKNMALANLHGEYKLLIVSPVSLKSTVLKLMDEQIKKKKAGRILVKINSLTDIDIIDKLKEASCAGVKVEMIVRGICCIIPGIVGETENITVRNIVGRFLEHSRIYVFGEGDEEKMYIASADFMTRNTERRVEIGCPVLDPEIRKKIHHILDLILRDNVKARKLLPDGNYMKFEVVGEEINSQKILLEEAQEEEKEIIGDAD